MAEFAPPPASAPAAMVSETPPRPGDPSAAVADAPSVMTKPHSIKAIHGIGMPPESVPTEPPTPVMPAPTAAGLFPKPDRRMSTAAPPLHDGNVPLVHCALPARTPATQKSAPVIVAAGTVGLAVAVRLANTPPSPP